MKIIIYLSINFIFHIYFVKNINIFTYSVYFNILIAFRPYVNLDNLLI